jgi:hypothetical protein
MSVCAAGQPAYSLVRRRIELSASARKFPPLTGRSGTQRARHLRPRTAADTSVPWSSPPPSDLRFTKVATRKRRAAVACAAHNGWMSSYGYLRVGSLIVSHLRNGVSDELMILFRDDMLDIRHARASEYYTPEKGYDEDSLDDDYEIDIVIYRAAATTIADRLDLMGVTPSAALAFLDEELNEYGTDLANSLDSSKWLDLLLAAPEGRSYDLLPEPGSRYWLLDQLDFDGYWDERHVLRAVLMAFPDAEVTLDLTELKLAELNLVEQNFAEDWGDQPLPWMVSDSAGVMRRSAAVNAPVVVLTEGRTDAEFLAAGLKILYPHLTDLIRFLDYDYRPEGGVGALVRMVRAFTAAGIVNRVVAIFDNDTAAADALKSLEIVKLPGHIRVLRYPPIDLASSYPTLGPPRVDSPRGSLSLADVNGSAGSIELYLGKDVLAREDGTLRPVQWKSFIPGMARYQGEVMDKELIHTSFRAKYAMALKSHAFVPGEDWEGLRLVIDAIRAAAQ